MRTLTRRDGRHRARAREAGVISVRPPVTSRIPGLLALSLAAAAALACTSGGDRPAPQPTIVVEGANVVCSNGDHGLGEAQLPWTFCYPPGWRFRERLQPSANPEGFDATFDITETSDGADRGKFGFMVVGTYDRAGAGTLAAWAAANLGSAPLVPETWGNAAEAGRLPDGDRLALTPHHVVRLSLRSGPGNLDLESTMARRLTTWKFVY